MTFGGYNDKLEDFANYVSNQISADLKNILPKDEAEFDRYKDILIRGLEVSIFEERLSDGCGCFWRFSEGLD